MGFFGFGAKPKVENEMLENLFDIETLNRTSCWFITRHLYKTKDRQMKNYYYSCLDTMFRKLDLYRTDKQKSYNWQCQTYPDYFIVHSNLIGKKTVINPETGKEMSLEERYISMAECQTCETCPKKKLRKDVVDDKLKPALSGAFLSTFPQEWIKEMNDNSNTDKAYLPLNKKEELLNSSYCNQYQPSNPNFVPYVQKNPTDFYIPTKENFEMEKQVLKYQYCINSVMCTKTIQKCLNNLKQHSENGIIENKHLSQCMTFDQDTIKCINSI